MNKIPAWFKAVFLVVRAIRKNGLHQTADALEIIGPQADFWMAECARLYEEGKTAALRGDIGAYNEIAPQHRAAIRRVKKEVCAPLDELTGIRNSIVEL